VAWKPKSGFLFHAKAFEDATFSATATPTKRTVSQAKKIGRKLKPMTVKGKLKAYLPHGIGFRGIKAATAPNYTYSVNIAAALNSDRRFTLKRNLS